MRLRWRLVLVALALGVLISAFELSASMRSHVPDPDATPSLSGASELERTAPGRSPSLTY